MYLHFMEDFYSKYNISEPVQVMISIALIFIVAFLFTRLTKLFRLPNVTAYMFTGILLGSYFLNMIPSKIVESMSFINSAGLGIIGFSSGRYFSFKTIKENGYKPLVISLIETVFSSVVIFLFMLIFKFDVTIALLLGIIGASTSAGSTVMTIRQYNCKGEFSNTIIELIAINNFLVLLVFSIVLGVVESQYSLGADFNIWQHFFLPIVINVAIILLGGLAGWIMAKFIIVPSRSKDNRLILSVAILLVLVSLCGLTNIFGTSISVSPLLSCMVFAMVYKNITDDNNLFAQVSDFCAPILLLFFVLSGMSLQFKYFASIGLAGLTYLLVRLVSKPLGVITGSLITRSNKNLIYYGGIAMYPQAGVSIGLASLLSTTLASLGKQDLGSQVSTIIIATSVVFEIIGPLLTKQALIKSKSLILPPNERHSIILSSKSMLKDVEVYDDDLSIQRKDNLIKTAKELEKVNTYIHTKEYSKEDYTNSYE